MSTILPPGAQAPPPQPAATAQAVPTAVVREPSVELLRAAAGTRIEGTVQPPPPAPPDSGRAAVQTLQNAVDTNRVDARTETVRVDAARAAPPSSTPAPPPAQTPAPPEAQAPRGQPAPTAPQPQAPVVHVRTPVGDVILRTPLPLPEGARVAFDVVSTNNNQVTVRFASLNGQPIQQALVQLAADRAAAPLQPSLPPTPGAGQLAPQGALTFGQAWTPGGPVSLTQAGPLNAFVLTGTTTPGLATAQAGAQPQLLQTGFVTGSDLTIRVTGLNQAQPVGATAIGGTPAASTNPTPTTPRAPITPGATPPALATAGATPSPTAPGSGTGLGAGQTTLQNTIQSSPQGPGSTLPTGGTAQTGIRLVGVQGWSAPPFATPVQTQPSPVQLALLGTITNHSTTAQPTIQTAAGTIQLASPANLPPGTTVTLEVLAQSTPRADAASAAPPPSTSTLPFTAGAAPWPTLTEALQVLQRSDPQAAQMLANTLPNGGPRTIVAAMSFIQSMRSGDIRQWPGDNNLRALERTGPRGANLARTLSGEVAQLSVQSRETAGEWRTTPLPWNAQGQIEKINLITRREDPDDEDDEKDEKKGGTGLRFLLDLELSQLGALQLDGMVHEDTKGFDMMIRSHEKLDDDIRRDLTGLFIAANQAVGLTGGLTFQVTPKFADPIGSSEPLKLEKEGVWA